MYVLVCVGAIGSAQVLQGLSSAVETLLQDLYSAREEKRKAEVIVSQVCSEREQLQARVRHSEVVEQRIEILESEVSLACVPFNCLHVCK